MTTGAQNSKTKLRVKTMRHLSVPELFFMFKPSNRLKTLSMLIDAKSYNERALRLKAAKNDVLAQCIISQKFTCAICLNPLLDFNDLSNISKMGQDIIMDDTIELSSSSESIGTNLILKYLENPWRSSIQIDHLIPKIIMKDSAGFQILEANVNKTALHTHCHKIKTKVDQSYFLKP
jgi:hypothetical protein